MASEGIRNRTGDGNLTLSSGAVSLTEIETWDLISEGELGGLLSGDYPISGVSGVAGEVGWRYRNFVPYATPPEATGQPWLRSVYWNEVPIISSQGKFNFQRVSVAWTPGLPNGVSSSELTSPLTVSRTIGERLRGSELATNGEPKATSSDYIKHYRIFNKECVGVIVNIKVPSLYETITAGDKAGQSKITSVEYKIWYRPMYSVIGKGTSSTPYPPKYEKIEGQATNGYVRSTRIDFPGAPLEEKNFIGWEIRIARLTPDSIRSSLRNQTYIESITEIYGHTFTYPFCSIVKSKFDAEFFQQVPSRAFHTNLLKVKIPSNYHPITKTYDEGASGWNGTFTEKKHWTDNPAWCYYDLLTNKRYGLGSHVAESQVDKWTLYEIGKYCDTLVPDGYGGLEPRFTCNLLLNTKEEAYKVLNDMASIFFAMTYYGGGTIIPVQDSPKTPIVLFTNANVENGDFSYSSSSKRARHTVSYVRYTDPSNFFKPAVEYVEDLDAIRRYGIREKEVTAFGCTSRGQAARLGRWIILSDTKEPESVTFVAGMEAAYLRPGDIFQVYDANRKARRNAGRTSQVSAYATGGVVLLDSTVELSNSIYYDLTLLTPTYFYDPATVSPFTSKEQSGIRRSQVQKFRFSGQNADQINNKTRINLSSSFNTQDYEYSGKYIWMLELASGTNTREESQNFIDTSLDLYRAIRIEERSENSYIIAGLQYYPNKFGEIESGLGFERGVGVTNYVPATPVDMSVNVQTRTANTKIIYYSFVVNNYSGVTSFKVYGKKNNFSSPTVIPEDDYLIATLPPESVEDTYIPAEGGDYYFRVYSYNDVGKIFSTGYASGQGFVENINPIQDIILSSLRLQGDTGVYNTDNGAVPVVTTTNINPVYEWQAGLPGDADIPSDLNYRVTIRPVSTTIYPSTTIYYEASGIQTNESGLVFEFGFETNINPALVANGPYRNYDVVVEAHNDLGVTSAGQQVGGASNTIKYQENLDGFDMISMRNPRPTGVRLTSGHINPPGYQTDNWISPNGDVNIYFNEGELPADLVGGFLFTHSGYLIKPVTSRRPLRFFTSGEAMGASFTPWTGIKITEFSFSPDDRTVSVPGALVLPNGKVSGYCAVSFYDSFDLYIKRKNAGFWSGLWLSNAVTIGQ